MILVCALQPTHHISTTPKGDEVHRSFNQLSIGLKNVLCQRNYASNAANADLYQPSPNPQNGAQSKDTQGEEYLGPYLPDKFL